jgi:hypothetical protein
MVKRLAWIFGIAGALIFAALTALMVFGEPHLRVPAIAALVTFSAIVIAYLGGIEGGLALRETAADERSRAVTFFLSALPTLAAWGVLWLDSPQHQVAAAIAIFVLVWACDLWLARHGLVASWFLDMRTAATALACAILGVALWLL